MRSTALVLTLFVGACTDTASPVHTITPPDQGSGRNPVTTPFIASGNFNFTGATAPGGATFTDAVVIDPETGDPAASTGGGSLNVTLDGTAYTDATIQSFTATITDDASNPYVVLGGYQIHTAGGVDIADEVIVVIKQSDFAVGATVALDGQDRVALFASGPADADQPAITGAAVTGSVTITAGSLALGDTVTASVQGDFGTVDLSPMPPPTGGAITAGEYRMAIDPTANVMCDGTLAGHETDFAGITSDSLALTDGVVIVATPTATTVTVDGDVIAAAYGTTPFTLDDQGGVFGNQTNGGGAGPDSTTVAGIYFALDGGSATANTVNGVAGAGYVTSDGAGTCSVGFTVLLQD